jgi:hypothetical protein
MESRVAALRAGLAGDWLASAGVVVALVAVLVMAYAGYAAGRFPGAAGPETTPLVRLLLVALALLGATIAAPALVLPRLVPIAAAVLRRTPAEVGNAVATTPPGQVVALVVMAILVAALVVAVRPGGPAGLERGFPRTPAYLPPRQSVAPGTALARGARAGRRLLAATADLAQRRMVLASLVAAAAAASLANALLH